MNMNSVEISEPAPFSADVSTIARWLSENWGIDMGYALSETEEWCNELASSQTETLFVGKLKNRIVGTVIICECDLEGYEHLTPWLSSLYVPKEFRGNSIGDQLTEEASNWASKQGHNYLYLYTEKGKLIPYYRSLGWRSMEDIQVSGDACQIMKKTLMRFA